MPPCPRPLTALALLALLAAPAARAAGPPPRRPDRHGDPLPPVALAVGGNRLACGDLGGRVHVWDLNSGKLLRTIPEAKALVWSLAFTPGGKRLAVLDDPPHHDRRRVRLIDLATGKERGSFTT